MDNFLRYKLQLKAEYDLAKSGDYANFLLQPTDAKLRELCSLRFKEARNQDDLITFKAFFGFPYEEGATNKMKEQTEKFRPLQTYLNNKTEIADYNYTGADMIAILLDYKQRPYSKFIRQDFRNDKGKSEDSDNNGPKATGAVPGFFKRFWAGILLFLIGLACFVNVFFLKKECMQWQSNHYEMVDCECKEVGIPTLPAVKYDAAQFKMKRIKVNPKTTFFINGKPCVWYYKSNNQIEYYNYPGLHPVLEVPLDPITHYMVARHVK